MVECQAIARVSRLGQKNKVKVIRYIMAGTVETVSSSPNTHEFKNTNEYVTDHAISTIEETCARRCWMARWECRLKFERENDKSPRGIRVLEIMKYWLVTVIQLDSVSYLLLKIANALQDPLKWDGSGVSSIPSFRDHSRFEMLRHGIFPLPTSEDELLRHEMRWPWRLSCACQSEQ